MYYNRGNVYLNKNRFDKAVADYEAAVRIKPLEPKFHHALGLTYEAQALQEEERMMKEGVEEEDYEENKENLGTIEASQGAGYTLTPQQSLVKAKIFPLAKLSIKHYLDALQVDENFVESRFHAALMMQKIYSFTDALKQLAKVIEMRGEDKTVWIQRGLVYQDMGNHDLAIEDFDKAIEKDTEYSKSRFHRATSKLRVAQLMQSYEKQKRIDDALEDFQQSLALNKKEIEKGDTDGDNPGILDGLGCCYHEMRDFEKARKYFDEAIEDSGSKDDDEESSTKAVDKVEFLKHRAQCYYDMGDFERSIADLTRGLSCNSKDPQVLYKLGLTYFADKKYKKCTQRMKEALKHRPFLTYEADIYYHLGLAYCRMEKFEKAIFPYSRCIDRIPSDLRYVHERAKAY